jgi:phage-related protein
VAEVVGPMATWIAHNQKLVGLLAAIIGPALAIVGVIKTISMVTKLWAAAQLILNAAMDANPIGLIVIAIAALVGGVIYAWTHFKTFREVVIVTFDAVKSAAIMFWHALEVTWKGIVAGVMWVWHAMEDAWSGVTRAVMSVWHTIESVWNTIWGVTEKVWGAISGFFQKWWPLLLMIFAFPIALIMSIWNHFHQEIEDTAKTAWNGIAHFFEAIWNWISSAASSAWSLISQYIIAPLTSVWHEIERIWAIITVVLSIAWGKVASVAQAAWSLIKKYILEPANQIWHDITGIFDKVAGTIGDALNSAWHSVENIGDKFLSVGEDLVMGIVHGIEGAAHWLTDKLKNLASDALKGAKSFLGISSPSKVFSDEVGQWIPHGIAQGVAQHAHVAHRAVMDLASSLSGSGHTSLAGPGLGAGGFGGVGAGMAYNPAAGGGGQTIVFDLRGSQVMSQRDMDQFVEKLGSRVATRTLAAGGVRIRM